MNTLHLCTKVPFPPKDGGALGIVSFISLLMKTGTPVTILAANTPKHEVEEQDIPREPNLKVIAVPVNTDINPLSLVFNFLFSAKPYNVIRFQSENFRNVLIQLLKQKQFDIVQLEGPHMGVYYPEIRKYSNAKIVLRAHNVEYKLWADRAAESGSLLRKIYLNNLAKRQKEFEKEIINNADAVLPVSYNDLKIIQEFASPKRSMVIQFGFSAENYFISGNVELNTLFFIGALDWFPNQSGLLWFLDNVWPLVHKNFPEVLFHIAGRNAPEWLGERLKLPNVYFHGEIENATNYINKYQIMVIPLFSGSGIRIKLLEGMALGKAILTTSKGAEGLDVRNGEQVIIAETARDFYSEIRRLLTTPSIVKALETEARNFICREFDSVVLSEKVDNFFKKIVQKQI